MRLLYTASDGRLRWTKDLIGDDEIPPYAILSHTWLEGQEVTFDDLKNLDNLKDLDVKSKAGYTKIMFCARQAQRDDLGYFWVDTCCIDKSSSAELSEAINSMFCWYQNAKRCYVYLPDVSNTASDGDSDASRRWKPAFKKSRWFTRGWTLQELIAPASVEFFSKEEERLGDKQSLEQTLHEITSIPIKALRGSPLCDFSVEERFSWAAKRQTTRKEDGAYCLLGIFDIQMPLLYGEGQHKAMKRLRKEVQGPVMDVPAALAHGVQSSSRSRNEKAGKIRQWLSAPDPSANYHKALKQRQDETGLWFLKSDQYARWKMDVASFIWLYGIPGCGKTILTSTILQDVLQHCNNDPGKVVAYFYFDFNDVQKQSPELMLRSLICQFLQQCFEIPESLDTLFSTCDSGQRQPLLHALVNVIQQMMQGFPHVYLVLDALDECAERAELTDTLETMAAWQLRNLHVLVTSRRVRDIETSLETFINSQNAICLQSDVVDVDIQKYVQQRLADDKRLSKWGKDFALKQEIEAVLMKGANGMFRWAVCQLDTLGECRTRAMLRVSLATLPPTLDKTYDRILSAISEADSQYAVPILQWLTFSARPLFVDEVAEVVAIDIKNKPRFDREQVLEDPLDVLNICSGLVTMTANEGDERSGSARQIVAIAHYSVKEYLLSDRIRKGSAARYSMQEAACHDAIAKGCLGYLLWFEGPKLLTQYTVKNFKLAEYCATFWVEHAQGLEEHTEGLNQAAVDLLSEKSDAYINWLRIHDPDKPWKDSNFQKGLGSLPPPLYYASFFGLREIVKLLLEKNADVNAQGGHYGNALQVASLGGHEQVVKLLLEKKANVNAQGGRYSNALQAASLGGYEQVVKLLLETNADVNAQSRVYGNALQVASLGGHEQVVKLLLEKKANVNAQGGRYSNALQAASLGGYEQVVKLLLKKKANVNAQGGAYGNALQAASWVGHEQVVKLLLKANADVNAQSRVYGNTLQAASLGGHEQVVKLLLEKEADVNAQGGYYGNALQAASHGGHEQVVKLLLEKEADVNAQGGYYGNALQAASHGGHEQVVKLLLKKKANVNAQGGYYGNALQAASHGGHEQVVKLLLKKKANVNAQGRYYGNAPQAASHGGHEQVVKLLLEKNANVNAQGGAYGNAL